MHRPSSASNEQIQARERRLQVKPNQHQYQPFQSFRRYRPVRTPLAALRFAFAVPVPARSALAINVFFPSSTAPFLLPLTHMSSSSCKPWSSNSRQNTRSNRRLRVYQHAFASIYLSVVISYQHSHPSSHTKQQHNVAIHALKQPPPPLLCLLGGGPC